MQTLIERSADVDTRRAEYEAYLRSPAWADLRQRTFERDGFSCRLCASPTDLRCHHRTYERFGHENLEDLTTLCEPCHAMAHLAFGGATRKTRKNANGKITRTADAERVILEWSKAEPDDGEYSVGAIAEAVGISPAVAGQACRTLRKRGLLFRRSKNRWFLPPRRSSVDHQLASDAARERANQRRDEALNSALAELVERRRLTRPLEGALDVKRESTGPGTSPG